MTLVKVVDVANALGENDVIVGTLRRLNVELLQHTDPTGLGGWACSSSFNKGCREATLGKRAFGLHGIQRVLHVPRVLWGRVGGGVIEWFWAMYFPLRSQECTEMYFSLEK